MKQSVVFGRVEERRTFLPQPLERMLFQHNSNGGGNSGILPKTKLSAKKASMPSSLLEEVGLCGDTFDGIETVVGDFCKKERILSGLRSYER